MIDFTLCISLYKPNFMQQHLERISNQLKKIQIIGVWDFSKFWSNFRPWHFSQSHPHFWSNHLVQWFKSKVWVTRKSHCGDENLIWRFWGGELCINITKVLFLEHFFKNIFGKIDDLTYLHLNYPILTSEMNSLV